METASIPTKSFREVHEELENENTFLHQNHNVQDFKSKADFLSSIGFTNSIATKIYAAIAENAAIIEEYKKKYFGAYKFILTPQLERVCEKYNLFVRETKYFLGDIPEKNIRDIMSFKICIDDLPISQQGYEVLSRETLSNSVLTNVFGSHKYLSIKDFAKYRLGWLIEIASIKSLFSEKAFEGSTERIIGTTQIDAKGQVDLDPIVLCRTKHGYMIITAWGDEANDELVLNEKMN
jgi:hypothetical protein